MKPSARDTKHIKITKKQLNGRQKFPLTKAEANIRKSLSSQLNSHLEFTIKALTTMKTDSSNDMLIDANITHQALKIFGIVTQSTGF